MIQSTQHRHSSYGGNNSLDSLQEYKKVTFTSTDSRRLSYMFYLQLIIQNKDEYETQLLVEFCLGQYYMPQILCTFNTGQ